MILKEPVVGAVEKWRSAGGGGERPAGQGTGRLKKGQEGRRGDIRNGLWGRWAGIRAERA